jgi:hypothetical protein
VIAFENILEIIDKLKETENRALVVRQAMKAVSLLGQLCVEYYTVDDQQHEYLRDSGAILFAWSGYVIRGGAVSESDAWALLAKLFVDPDVCAVQDPENRQFRGWIQRMFECRLDKKFSLTTSKQTLMEAYYSHCQFRVAGGGGSPVSEDDEELSMDMLFEN